MCKIKIYSHFDVSSLLLQHQQCRSSGVKIFLSVRRKNVDEIDSQRFHRISAFLSLFSQIKNYITQKNRIIVFQLMIEIKTTISLNLRSNCCRILEMLVDSNPTFGLYCQFLPWKSVTVNLLQLSIQFCFRPT